MKLFLDVECYPNYFLIVFKTEDGKLKCFELDEYNTYDRGLVIKLLSNYETIGFNSRNYDIPMILRANELTLDNSLNSNDILKKLSDEIIENGSYDTLCKYKIWTPTTYNHIDIINVAKGKSSLKMYGARIHTNYLQDLPYEPSKVLTKEEKEIVKKYCINDIDITIDLYNKLEKEIEIRRELTKEYSIDLRSLSDAQIAEKLIKHKLDIKKSGYNSQGYNFNYIKPKFIKFNSDYMNMIVDDISNANFSGHWGEKITKNEINRKLKIADKNYTIGIGGLHSNEKSIKYEIDKDEFLIDIDVTSYYPTIILNNHIYPDNLGKSFLNLYNKWYLERLEAKKNNRDTLSWLLKIVLNGAFGKFADINSVIYCPKSLIQTTITGQLSLLMLIEMLVEYDFEVVSANTDGLTVKGKNKNKDKFLNITNTWEKLSGFKLEHTYYTSIYIQSVNNYIAIKSDNKLKTKGIFAEDALDKNPSIGVCKKAIIDYILYKNHIEDIIYNEELDVKKFLIVRKSKYGAYYKNEYLGKVVRWYWTNDGEPILDSKGNKVAQSDYAKPIMNLNDGITNINYEKYIFKTKKLMKSIGIC